MRLQEGSLPHATQCTVTSTCILYDLKKKNGNRYAIYYVLHHRIVQTCLLYEYRFLRVYALVLHRQ